MKILILEPYYGGSHKQFLLGLQEHVEDNYTSLTLPARKWKMRMQLAAPWFAKQIRAMAEDERSFDTVLCSTFIDVAVFRGLATMIPGWNHSCEIVTYFHENQFVYPNQVQAPDNKQFAAINFMTALASDKLAFNSEYNRKSFLGEIDRLVKKGADMKMPEITGELYGKSSVIYPGIDFSTIDSINSERMEDGQELNSPPIIVWNHRWEHDKNPEEFFEALKVIKSKNISFRLIVLGQSFNNIPDCFVEAETFFKEELIHFGYAEDYPHYAKLLQQADIVVSTAIHEFYGISVIEAVRAGCIPVLPKRLSYPELFDQEYLYKDGKLAKRLENLLLQKTLKKPAKDITERYSWQALATTYKEWLS